MAAKEDVPCGCVIETESVRIGHGEIPTALTHWYPLPHLEDRVVPLYRGRFRHAGRPYYGLGRLTLDPRPRVEFVGNTDVALVDVAAFLGEMTTKAEWKDPDEVLVTSRVVPRPPATSRFRSSPKAGVGTSELRPGTIEVGSADHVDEVTFWIINGWQADYGLRICHDGRVRTGRIELVLAEWSVRIDPRTDLLQDEVRKHGLKTGDSNVTHVGRIRRVDLESFHAHSADEVFDVIDTGASFAVGRISGAVLPVGWRDGSPTWARWQSDRAIDRPTSVMSWLDGYVAHEQLPELFECLWKVKSDPLRWEVFRRALGYYFSAQYEATVTMTVLLPISALAMVSFAHFTDVLPASDPKRLSRTKWGELNAECAVRLLLDELGLDLSVPTHFAQLRAAKSRMSSARKDALSAIVKMRNDVAHPTRDRLGKWDDLEWAEAGFSAMGFFDAALLWWVGFTGRYLPRDSPSRGLDSSISVPWANGSA